MNPQTITTEELLALTKSADLLRQTAEQALRCDSLARELHNVRNDRDHLAGILEKVARVFDDPDEGPEDFHQLPQAVERLRLKCETLKGEVVTAGNHAACRLNVLKDIHRVLGSDGGPTGVNTLTGVPPQMTRLPKRIEQLLADVTTWRERYEKEVFKNGELMRENETLARNAPPKPPLMEEVANVDPVVMTYDPACFRITKHLGQAWCKTDRATTDLVNFAFKFDMQTHYIVLCNAFQNVKTGAFTYVPIPVDVLPQVTNTAAS